MAESISIIKKDEAYSYDELNFLEEKLLPLIKDKTLQTAVRKTLQSLKESLVDNKNSMAIFFMPQTTFNIFSLIQGDNSICKITEEELEALYKTFELADTCKNQPIYSHLQKKIRVLLEYLQQGNDVTPTAIQVDERRL